MRSSFVLTRRHYHIEFSNDSIITNAGVSRSLLRYLMYHMLDRELSSICFNM